MGQVGRVEMLPAKVAKRRETAGIFREAVVRASSLRLLRWMAPEKLHRGRGALPCCSKSTPDALDAWVGV